jgi:hypothetical protein
MNRSGITVTLALILTGCGTGSAPGTQAAFSAASTSASPTAFSPTAASPTATPLAMKTVAPAEGSPPPPSATPAPELASITESDVTGIAASTGQTCTSDDATIECQTASQSKGIQARRADDGTGLLAVTAQAYSSDTTGYAYLTNVCSLTQSYSAAVIRWVGANRAKTDIVRMFGPYRVEYWGPPGRGILSIRPAG